ncbi:MAG: ABC transporter ATP-binding protein, partial [Thermoanaerobaculia bacterium]|nr:ABC transporter ATP-binding protein [Thermoanaerobaculia bacterium]
DRPVDRLLELFGGRRHRLFRALEDVSFELPAGMGMGVVGENGAGKSTLLKILAGVASPTRGEVEVSGNVAAILELGSGFHQEFTGRQNIRLNAAMLGLGPDEVEAKTPEIIAFSELGDFIDQPVKVYSTGMVMRLGFSIAVQVDPDVLIVDEALSVGDGYFQKKCMDKMREFIEGGGTLLLCSHAMYYVTAFCQQALWIQNGRTELLGPANDVVREYEDFLVAKSEAGEGGEELPGSSEEPTDKPARLRGVRLDRTREEGPAVYATGDPLEVSVQWESTDPEIQFQLGIGIDRADGVQVASFTTLDGGGGPFTGRREYRARLRVPELPLVKGNFDLYVHLMDEHGLHPFDMVIETRAFRVTGDEYEIGLVRVPHRWDFEVERV